MTTEILKSRIFALKATRAALAAMGVDGDKYIVVSYDERKRQNDRRFVVLNLEAEGFDPLTSRVRMHKADSEWVLTQLVDLGLSEFCRYNLPYKRLAYAVARVSLPEAMELIQAFKWAFPSLYGIEPRDVVRAVTAGKAEHYGYNGHEKGEDAPRQEAAMARIEAAIEEASVGGKWPATAVREDVRSWTPGWNLTLTPYVGDRRMIVHGGLINVESGSRHGTSQLVTITIDLLERPSGTAMQKVIPWLLSHPHSVEMLTFAEGEPAKRDPWEEGHVNEWREFFHSFES